MEFKMNYLDSLDRVSLKNVAVDDCLLSTDKNSEVDNSKNCNKKIKIFEDPEYLKTFNPLEIYRSYKLIEHEKINIDGKFVHLYPTAKVRKIYNMFEKNEEFWNCVPVYFKFGNLTLEEDTTIYWSENFVQKNFSVSVEKENNRLSRPNMTMEDKIYIFVISKKGELFATTKKMTEDGRIQHSSLVEGKPVLAAGSMCISENGKRIDIINESGHYTPKKENLEVIIKWFEASGLQFKVTHDGDVSSKDPDGKEHHFRLITLVLA